MKKLLNFVTTVMMLLMASTINATAATTNSVKTDTTTKVNKNIIDYSKMNYNQLNEEHNKFKSGERSLFKQTFLAALESTTDAKYKKLCNLFDEAMTKILPLQKEVEKRMEKHKDNEEVYEMYNRLYYDIKTTINMFKSLVKSGEKKLKETKMKTMY